MLISFEVPCVVRARHGRSKAVRQLVTTTRVVHDVPVIHESQAELAYAVEMGRPSDGYSHFWHHAGAFYRGTLVFDADASRDGWPVMPTDNPKDVLQSRLWLSVLDGVLSGGSDTFVLDTLMTFLSGTDPVEVQDARWELLDQIKSVRATPETEEDLARVHADVAHVLDDLVIIRRELHIRTGQPCYAVNVRGKKANVVATTTAVHERLRAVPFTHPISYPHERFMGRLEAERHYFAIEDREAMRDFIAGAGAKVPVTLPRGSRLKAAVHDETIDGLELDRVSRVAVHDIASAFAGHSLFALAAPLLRHDRAFFDAFFDLREFLEAVHDPEETREELWSRLVSLNEACADPRDGASVFVNSALAGFLSLAMARYDDSPVVMNLLAGGGPLPAGGGPLPAGGGPLPPRP